MLEYLGITNLNPFNHKIAFQISPPTAYSGGASYWSNCMYGSFKYLRSVFLAGIVALPSIYIFSCTAQGLNFQLQDSG